MPSRTERTLGPVVGIAAVGCRRKDPQFLVLDLDSFAEGGVWDGGRVRFARASAVSDTESQIRTILSESCACDKRRACTGVIAVLESHHNPIDCASLISPKISRMIDVDLALVPIQQSPVRGHVMHFRFVRSLRSPAVPPRTRVLPPATAPPSRVAKVAPSVIPPEPGGSKMAASDCRPSGRSWRREIHLRPAIYFCSKITNPAAWFTYKTPRPVIDVAI